MSELGAIPAGSVAITSLSPMPLVLSAFIRRDTVAPDLTATPYWPSPRCPNPPQPGAGVKEPDVWDTEC